MLLSGLALAPVSSEPALGAAADSPLGGAGGSGVGGSGIDVVGGMGGRWAPPDSKYASSCSSDQPVREASTSTSSANASDRMRSTRSISCHTTNVHDERYFYTRDHRSGERERPLVPTCSHTGLIDSSRIHV